MATSFKTLLSLGLSAQLALAAPTPPPNTSENPGQVLKKRQFNLTDCAQGTTRACLELGTGCTANGQVWSNSEWCQNNCRCDWTYLCPGFGGCKVAQPGDEDEGEGAKATQTDNVEGK